MEFVEVRGKSVEVAVAGALAELGIESEEQAEIEVISEGKKGFLGMGGEDAVVKVRPKPKKKRRRRRRGKGSGSGENSGQRSDQGTDTRGQSKPSSQGSRPKGEGQKPKRASSRPKPKSDPEPAKAEDLDEQTEIVESFLTGLIGAFGIEGEVTVETNKGAIEAAVAGEHSEALVGNKGAVMNAVQEVTRTVVQRRFHQPARVRVDVAGYRARRREALAIYAERLAKQVIDEGGEIMLEPMNPADRKVVHDTVGGIDGVESYSEGDDPRRSVVLSKTEAAAE